MEGSVFSPQPLHINGHLSMSFTLTAFKPIYPTSLPAWLIAYMIFNSSALLHKLVQQKKSLINAAAEHRAYKHRKAFSI